MRVVVLLLVLTSLMASAQEPGPEQLFSAAIQAQQQGDFQTAIRDYRKILVIRPNALEVKVNLGAALAQVGDFDAAIAEYRGALAAAPHNLEIRSNLALAYYKKGDFTNARKEFEEIHAAQPKDARIATLLGDTEDHLGDYAAAIALLTPLESANSGNPDFEYVLALAMISGGHRRDGAALMERVAQTGNSADAYMLAGSALLDLNELEQGRRDLEEALRLDPKLPGIYTLVGTARDKNADSKGAEDAFRESLKLNPDDFDANLYLGAILYKRRDVDEAKPYLTNALRLKPSSSMARYEMAMLKSTSKDYEAAAKDLEEVIKEDPNWLEPHVELASLYYRLHRPEDGAKERQIVDRLTAAQQQKGPGKP